MSATNKALLNITKKDTDAGFKKSISPANVPNIESRFKASFFFAIGVLSSLSLIGWATLNNSAEVSPVLTTSSEIPTISKIDALSVPSIALANSPTQKSSAKEVSAIYIDNSDKLSVVIAANTNVALPATKQPSVIPKTPREEVSQEFQVEEVELLPSELAQKSRDAAKKALDRSDFKEATKEYYTVLKYQPNDEESRKKLAALLYGKRDVTEAAAILQQGIKLDNDSVNLRLALASLLQKEKQPEAALSVLEYIPLDASVDYLATRGGLAQKLKLMDLANESYQMLVKKEPDNGRWWLGLAIVYEREAKTEQAYDTYQTALIKPGLSRSSLVFVRDRIKLLATMKGNE
ncbi:tetratricopeptide repeat protein [Aliivibrio sifiae]|uniref:tetratricopeptide repeat protein n=1 Tax=Aliivibrio sifiae TaxID=566293 RepID=UPI0015E3374C|nr:tetratricopeptide repeat protein [Aliivibrio sifiae]